ncbi:MAG: ester cyclase [Bacteroidetes bacterium]|nr:ester cyclase [Bacteroidota bacterium]HET6244465.1 ester cyclase [Bacteroidia bacterium]
MEKNVEIVTKAFKLFEAGKVDQFDQYMHENIVEHTPDPAFTSNKKGLEYFKEIGQTYFDAMSDFKIEIQQVLNCENKVVVLSNFKGKHTGNLFDIEPTNKNISFTNIDIFTIENGMITEHWGVGDNLGMLMQMGVITEKELSSH